MDFDCDYNAPMYCDFGAIVESKDPRSSDSNSRCSNDNEIVEKYFEIDHERKAEVISIEQKEEIRPFDSRTTMIISKKKEVQLDNLSDKENVPDINDENVKEIKENSATKKKYNNILTEWKSGITTKKIIMEARKSRSDTPERRSLKQAVAKTLEDVANSPKLLLPKRDKKRSNGGQPRLLVISKGSSSSKRRSSVGTYKKRESLEKNKRRESSEKSKLKNRQGNLKVPENKNAKTLSPSRQQALVNRLAKKGPVKALNSKAVNFSQMLRNYNSKQITNVQPEPQKPMALSHRQRANSVDRLNKPIRSGVTSAYVPLAEAIHNIEKKVPDRFRSIPRGRSNTPGRRPAVVRARSASPAITVGFSPNLVCGARKRQVHVLSAEEELELELQNIKKNQFKARAIGEGIKFSKPPSIHPKPTTKVQPFHLSSSNVRTTLAEEPLKVFKANPVPTTILKKRVGVPKKKVISNVKPESPQFQTKERMKEKNYYNHYESTESINSVSSTASSVCSYRKKESDHDFCHGGIPTQKVYKPKPIPKPNTVPQPFSFLERDAALEQKKQDKIKEYLEKERKEREFKANPLPNFEKAINLPIKHVILPTEVEAFNLEIEKRVEPRLKKFEEDVELELKKQKEAANFKARPLPSGEQFVPVPSTRPFIEISNFELHSERRAQERYAFELKKKEKEIHIMEQKKQMEELRRMEEEEEIRLLRQEAVHKSNPVRQYVPLKIRSSEKPATVAHSPDLSYKKSHHPF